MSEPTLTRQANALTFTWPSVSIAVQVSRIREHSGEAKAEILVTNGTGVLTQQSINLLAGRSRHQLATELTRKHPLASVSWETICESVAVLGLRELRKGEPIALLQPTDQTHVPFLINPLIYGSGHQALIYAPGGSCKSYLALWLALLASHGAIAANIRTRQVPVLYLDWELNADTIGGRLQALRNGHPELNQYVPFYRRCEHPLAHDAEPIRAFIQEHGIQLVILDSVAMACGAKLTDPEAAITLQRTLRELNCSSLVLAHVAKSTTEGQERSAYGTVFFRELARNVWELTREEGSTNPVNVVLKQTKNNFGPIHAPLGLSLAFQQDAVTVGPYEPEDAPAVEGKLTIQNRIRNLLEQSREPLSVKQIAETLGVNDNVLSVTLSRGNGEKWHKVGEHKETKWTVL